MRRSARTQVNQFVRMSVAVPVDVHARLCALAALRQVDRSTLAASFIRAGLRGVQIHAPAESAEPEQPAA